MRMVLPMRADPPLRRGRAMFDSRSIVFASAPEAGDCLAARLRGRQPLFVCVIASTDTALIPGLSAAGATTELIPFTAAADAEVLAYGAARCINGVPCNPLGPPGPAIITRAALELGRIPHLIVSAGCRVLPQVDYVELGAEPGALISRGHAVGGAHDLFDRGRRLGRELASAHDYLVVGESVPGGTTTALALMLALGIRAEGRVSSSMAGNAHELKSRVAHEALAHLDPGEAARNPLAAVETLGDPMQPAVAGIAAGAADTGTPVLLAGGTQMIAVLALLRRLQLLGLAATGGDIGVATTRWVVSDPTADATGLMCEVGDAPLLATALCFAEARSEGLRLYEANLVKEGVGAGGSCVAASLAAGVSCASLAARVEQIHEEMQASVLTHVPLGSGAP